MLNAFLFLLFLILKTQVQPCKGGFNPVKQRAQVSSRLLYAVKMADDSDKLITILGFGSLLSEKSSRITFPELKNFRLGRVPNYRRVFAHPASIFFQRKIADLNTLEMSSLSVEYVEGDPGFVASVFEVSNKNMMKDGVPSQDYLEREEEFNIVTVPFIPFGEEPQKHSAGMGIICERSSDEEYLRRWGQERFNDHFAKYGVVTIWGWKEDSGLLPCAVYLRHCYLSAKSMGDGCLSSFLDETFLVDRKTSIRSYLEKHPSILDQLPPPELEGRYSG
jgi:hypothetical protein